MLDVSTYNTYCVRANGSKSKEEQDDGEAHVLEECDVKQIGSSRRCFVSANITPEHVEDREKGGSYPRAPGLHLYPKLRM